MWFEFQKVENPLTEMYRLELEEFGGKMGMKQDSAKNLGHLSLWKYAPFREFSSVCIDKTDRHRAEWDTRYQIYAVYRD